MSRFAIKSKNIVTPGGLRNGVIIINKNIIEDVPDDIGTGEIEIIDAGELIVMPGIIDPHVHINEPGRTDWEGFDTATKAALAGGITTLIEMPLNASPVTTTVPAFEKKIEAAQNQLHMNCGFWGGAIPGNSDEIEPLIANGVFGFKAFLVHSGIDEFPNVSEEDLRKVMPLLSRHNFPLLVHCELQQSATHVSPGETRSYQSYLASRPKEWEDNAIALMIKLCEAFNCHTHIVHLSSASSIEQIKRAKEKGLPLTCETAQHYLYFTAEQIPDGNTSYKCAPPIREKQNNERLWEALKTGIIDFVATDHSPAPPALKEVRSGNLMKAWGGIASLQFSLPVLWTSAKDHGSTVADLSRWLSSNPAILPGLHSSKGKIEKGYDADLVIWDPFEKFIVTENIIHHKHKISPYLGEELFGVVKQTWLGGEKVYESGKFLHLNKGKLLLNKKEI